MARLLITAALDLSAPTSSSIGWHGTRAIALWCSMR